MAVFSGDRLSALSLGAPSLHSELPTTGNRSPLGTSMTDDVRISVGLAGHHKTKKLKRRLGPGSCWSLVVLFLWAGKERWDGTLHGMTDEDIELAAEWEGEPGALVSVLLEVRFLEGNPGLRAIHNWKEHNPYAASKGERIEKGKVAAMARWHGKKGRPDSAGHATSMPIACSEHATTIAEQCPPAPTPAPTLPTEAKAPTAPPAKRGQRLPVGWSPSDDDVTFAVELRVDWRREADAFRDYWYSKPGQQAVKLDWSATWRNWIRRSAQKVSVQAQPQKSKTLQAVERLQRMIDGHEVDGAGNRNGAVEALVLEAPGHPFGGHD